MKKNYVLAGIVLWAIFLLISTAMTQFGLGRNFYNEVWMLLAVLFFCITLSGSLLLYFGVKST